MESTHAYLAIAEINDSGRGTKVKIEQRIMKLA